MKIVTLEKQGEAFKPTSLKFHVNKLACGALLDTRQAVVVSCQKKRQQGFTKQWTWELTFMTLLNALFWRAEREQKKTVENHCKECNERKMEQNAMSIFSYEFLLGKQSYFERLKLIKIFTCDANRKFDIWTTRSTNKVIGQLQIPNYLIRKPAKGKLACVQINGYVHSLLFLSSFNDFSGARRHRKDTTKRGTRKK